MPFALFLQKLKTLENVKNSEKNIILTTLKNGVKKVNLLFKTNILLVIFDFTI